MKTDIVLWSYLAQFFLEWKVFQIKVVEIIKPRILCSVITFSKNCALYEIMWKNIVEPYRPQMTILHLFIACWIPKSTNVCLEFDIQVTVHHDKFL